jgi:hypothetical protein
LFINRKLQQFEVHSGKLYKTLSIPNWSDKSSQIETVFKRLLPKTDGYMRLDVAKDGTCKDIAEIPIQILNTKDMQPFRRNGPIDIFGDYGKLDCVLVALNGAFGGVYLTRADLVDIQPLFATGGLSIDPREDQTLRDLIAWERRA